MWTVKTKDMPVIIGQLKLCKNLLGQTSPLCCIESSYIWSWNGFLSFFVRFLCLYPIEIHISEAISIELCTRLPLRLQEVVGYVWTHSIPAFRTFWPRLSRAGGAIHLPHPHIHDSWACSWRRVSRPQLRVPTGSVLHCGWCIKNAGKWTECVCENGNLMRRAGSEQWIAIALRLCKR